MKRFQYLLGAAIFLGVGLLLGFSIPRQAPSVSVNTSLQAQTSTASLMFDEGNGVVKIFEKLPIRQGETLFELTRDTAAAQKIDFKNDPPGKYGILITEMDGKKNGTGGAYWGYWVNNHLGDVSSDAYIIKSGDVFEWKFVNLKM